MRARLVKSKDGKILLLCPNGSISEGTTTVLSNLLVNFQDADYLSGNYGNWNEEYPDMALFPGETLAIITDSCGLLLFTFDPFVGLLGNDNVKLSKYISVAEYAKKHNKSHEIIKVFCREGKIHGATKKGNVWMIPEDSPYPVPPEMQKPGSGRQRQKK